MARRDNERERGKFLAQLQVGIEDDFLLARRGRACDEDGALAGKFLQLAAQRHLRRRVGIELGIAGHDDAASIDSHRGEAIHVVRGLRHDEVGALNRAR